jgi:uncharacterized membrane protein YidH (DUF202 family)
MDALPVEGLKSEHIVEEATFLAAERTLFSVMSTGLAIAAGGALVTTLLGDAWPDWVQVPLVAVFLLVGYSMTLLGLRRYQGIVRMARSRSSAAGRRMMSLRALSVGVVLLEAAIVVVIVLFLIGAFQATTEPQSPEDAPSASSVDTSPPWLRVL